jgi:hypothetical protein
MDFGLDIPGRRIGERGTHEYGSLEYGYRALPCGSPE